MFSTISNIRAKLGSRRDTVITNNSFENIREERFWEILGNSSETGQESRKTRVNKKVLNRGNTLPGGRGSNGDIGMVTRRQISDSPREKTNTDLAETTDANNADKDSDSSDSPNDKSNLLPDK